MVNTHAIGRKNEELAAAYLIQNGYKVIARNFRCKLGEIDIVAREGTELVFVEVKSRSSQKFGRPQESVTRKKQAKIRQVALYYMQINNLFKAGCRFDVLSVTLQNKGLPEIEIIKNAF